MTEYIASSEEVGLRPRIVLIRAYSSSFKPSSTQGCFVSGFAAAVATVSKLISDLLVA